MAKQSTSTKKRGSPTTVSVRSTDRRGARRKKAVGFGVVKITGGAHIGRIGFYDDDDIANGRAIVYFGNMSYATGYYYILLRYLAGVTTADLLGRREAIDRLIAWSARHDLADAERADLLAELLLIDNALGDRMIVARVTEPRTPKRVFISHSSRDKQFARWIAVDLTNAGHSAWLDEWDIRVGESIPTRIAEGIDECEAMIVVLSEHAIASHWVEREWQAKYWDEVKEGRVRVLPALLQPCKIPTLLKSKKYADFSAAYTNGIKQLLDALR